MMSYNNKRGRSLLARSFILVITLMAAGGSLLYQQQQQQQHYRIFPSFGNYVRRSGQKQRQLAAQTSSSWYLNWLYPDRIVQSTAAAARDDIDDRECSNNCLVEVVDPLARTHKILRDLSLNGSSACHNVSTRSFKLVGVGGARFHEHEEDQTQAAGGAISIPTDTVFHFWIVSMGGDGEPRCAGGDYYETQLAGERWRSRPRVSDLGNGTYRVSFMVDRAFPGPYTFFANLLFSNFHGLDLEAHTWAVPPLSPMINKTLSFLLVAPGPHDPNANPHVMISGAISRQLPLCTPLHLHYNYKTWHGRWTRSWYNRTCRASPDGRFDQCLQPPAHTLCTQPWCHGHVSLLESNGWVYSAHCAFRIWERQQAWDCLAGKWLFFWGDSNMQDYIRNILIFLLGHPVPSGTTISTWTLDRNLEQTFTNSHQQNQTIRISLVFNGHHNVYEDGLGLDSLLDPHYRDRLETYFNQTSSAPNAFVFNTGLHDGTHFPSLSSFVGAINQALSFWQSIFKGASPERIILRTSVAPAGASRYMQSNPHKLEVFNIALIEHFRRVFPDLYVIDAFDPSFPFHFDHCCSDGGHYGRPPNFYRQPWYGKPHQYFVDLMLSHMLLTSICMNPA